MAQYPKALFHQIKLDDPDHATLVFKGRGQSVSMTLDLPSLNALVAASMNTLRSAQQQKSQMVQYTTSQASTIDHMIPLPLDYWQVTTADQLPGQVILHILAAGGLYLTYSLLPDGIRAMVAALQKASDPAQSNSPPTGIH